MKILHMHRLSYPFVGGIVRFALPLMQALQARGHEHCVIASHRFDSEPDKMIITGIPIHRVPLLAGLTYKNPGYLLRSLKRAAQIKRDFRPDIIHLHIGGPIAFLYLATEKVSPAPLVVTAYDLVEPMEESTILRQVLEKASAVAAISRVRLDECKKIAPQAAERIKLIYVSRPSAKADPPSQPAPQPLVFMAGRQVSEKGFDLAIAAFATVIKHYPEARLVLAGQGPMHADLMTQVARLGLQDVVRLAGVVGDAELRDLYRQAWMTLVPSRHSESFGLVALEAMQAGCPVIASRVGGLPEVVQDGQTGLLVPKDDPVALAEAMLRLLDNQAWAWSLGQAGQERARTVFDWDMCVDSYESLYQEALQTWHEKS